MEIKHRNMGQAEDAQDAHAHFSFEVPAWHAASVATSTATATATFLLHKQHVYLKDADGVRAGERECEKERKREREGCTLCLFLACA